jgi:hypothetical protein
MESGRARRIRRTDVGSTGPAVRVHPKEAFVAVAAPYPEDRSKLLAIVVLLSWACCSRFVQVLVRHLDSGIGGRAPPAGFVPNEHAPPRRVGVPPAERSRGPAIRHCPFRLTPSGR